MLQFKILQKFTCLTHGISTKKHGNASFKWGKKLKVIAARKKICRQLDIASINLVELKQIHSKKISPINTRADKIQHQESPPQADGLITNLKGTFLLINTADCAPIFLFDPKQLAVGLIHAGFKGVKNKIHQQAVSQFKKHYHSNPQDIIIGIGPCICSSCYHRHFDLRQQIIKELLNSNISPVNIEISSICTYENHNYFSHQRSYKTKKPEGRFASIIGLKQ